MSISDYKHTPKYRYENDPQFRQLTDMLEHLIGKAQFAPSEVREAAILTCINYEMRHVRTYAMPKGVLPALQTLEKFRKAVLEDGE